MIQPYNTQNNTYQDNTQHTEHHNTHKKQYTTLTQNIQQDNTQHTEQNTQHAGHNIQHTTHRAMVQCW